MKCYIIILNYNSFKDTIECVDSLYDFLDLENIQIVVVDNNSTDESSNILKEKLPNEIVFLESMNNRGYANGNNIGIRYAVEHNADYICILNNDVIVTEDFLTPCFGVLNSNGTGFVGPRIMDHYSGLIQSTGGEVIIEKGLVSPFNKDTEYSDDIPPVINCDVVYGACIMFKTSILKEIGFIPEDYFLYYEETDWCYRARKLGYVNKCVTTVSVSHKGGASTDVFSETGLIPYLHDRNRIVFTKKYLSNSQLLKFFVYDVHNTLSECRNRPRKFLRKLSRKLDGYTGRVKKKYSFIYVSNKPN